MKKRILGFVVSFLLISCSGSPPPLNEKAQKKLLRVEKYPGPRDFKPAGKILKGLDDRTGEVGWKEGDSVLFGAVLRKKHKTVKWLIKITVFDMKHIVGGRYTGDSVGKDGKKREIYVYTDVVPVKVELFDGEKGNKLNETEVNLPYTLLKRGIYDVLKITAIEKKTGKRSSWPISLEIKRLREVVCMMMTLLNVLKSDRVLSGYFWRLLEKPGLLTFITHMGMHVEINCLVDGTEEVESLPSHLSHLGDGVTLPMRVELNGTPSLYVKAIGIRPCRPYSITGGIVYLNAKHPKYPDMRFEMVLLAARQAVENR